MSAVPIICLACSGASSSGLYGIEVKVDVVARGEDDLSGASNLE